MVPEAGRLFHAPQLAMTASASYTYDGGCATIRATSSDLLERFLPWVPPGWRPSHTSRPGRVYSIDVHPDSGGGQFALHAGAGGRHCLYSSADLEAVLDRLESALHERTALSARSRLFVHAGVVGWRGRAILIPGRSRSGKSTLVAELIRAGASYYSDEYAVLDADGRVHPYPRRLSLRGNPPMRVTAEALGGKTGCEPLRAGLVLVTEYQPGGTWKPESVSRGRALLALLSNMPLARKRAATALPVLARTVAEAAAERGARGDAAETAEALLDRWH